MTRVGAVRLRHRRDRPLLDPEHARVPGFDRFPGRVLHSHDFRDAQEFAGGTCWWWGELLRRGHRPPGEEVRRETVTISYRPRPWASRGPTASPRCRCSPGSRGDTAHFGDGTSRDVDAIVLCTGYRHHFPFIASDLRLRTTNVLYPPDLYKGVVWIDNPKMMYLGMQDQFYTFTLFDAEAWYARDYVLGRIELPSREEMAKDVAEWRAREAALPDAIAQIDFQADYIATSWRDRLPDFDLDLTRAHFKKWEHDKEESIVGYRDRGFSSPCTGSEAPIHHTAWWEAHDDSLTTFLGTGRTAAAG